MLGNVVFNTDSELSLRLLGNVVLTRSECCWVILTRLVPRVLLSNVVLTRLVPRVLLGNVVLTRLVPRVLLGNVVLTRSACCWVM